MLHLICMKKKEEGKEIWVYNGWFTTWGEDFKADFIDLEYMGLKDRKSVV